MNNYDQSSSGENIDFSVFYDTSLAQIYFDDWLKGYDGYQVNRIDLGGRDDYAYLLGDSSKPFYKKSELNKMHKADLIRLMIKYDNNGYYENEALKSELITDLLKVTIKQHYDYLASEYCWGDFYENVPHDRYISRGYSQGDAAIIIFLNNTDDVVSKKYIDHIFWDCPIFIRAKINGIEYYDDCFLNDQYEWDADAVKARIMAWTDCSDYAKNWLIQHLPDYPSWL